VRSDFVAGRPNPPTLAAIADDETLELVFGALSHPVRRGILGAIHDLGGPMRSGDIAERFDISWQAVSRHLALLTDAGLLRCEDVPNGRLYSIDEDRLRSVPGRWITRVATPVKRSRDGRQVQEPDE
jgi:DNA-binding transcriptional ArsR family regulator